MHGICGCSPEVEESDGCGSQTQEAAPLSLALWPQAGRSTSLIPILCGGSWVMGVRGDQVLIYLLIFIFIFEISYLKVWSDLVL